MELTVALEDPSKRMALFGVGDAYLRQVRAAFDVRITARDSTIHLVGEPSAVGKAARAMQVLQEQLRGKPQLDEDDISGAILSCQANDTSENGERLLVYAKNVFVEAQTEGQEEYIRTMQEKDLTLCLGPAGTGKTYLAVGLSVSMLKSRQIKRIVLVRPAVEAGEKLGYLPGDMQAKVNPYLRPLFDAMNNMMTFDQIKRFMQNDIIEVIPLAFMRGRTLNNAAIILDEAQNTTVAQMLMFLTRLGFGSKMIVTGDDSQIDLAKGETCGLIDAVKRLGRFEDIGVVRLKDTDIVRHRLVTRIVNAYGNSDARR